jgi:hypothetical protein
VPGWHEATRQLANEGKVQVVGIIQEQHPDRCRLFMQWKGMDWPILVDSQNLLDVSAVPITLLIDEYGVIRGRGGRARGAREAVEAFIARTFEPPERQPGPRKPDLVALEKATATGRSETFRAYGEAILACGDTDRIDRSINAFQKAVELDPEDGRAHFRLGVAHRMHYDSSQGQAEDFQRAVAQWSRALAIDPNQYIWRRRIQQYGPRLDKPYPFYDWVVTARVEIGARGEEPAPLVVEPRGSEFAAPVREFTADVDAVNPDPLGRVLRDEEEFVQSVIVAVPAAVEPGGVARIHLMFEPLSETEAHWNNEAEPMILWVDPPEGWQVDSRAFTYPLPPEVVTKEQRTIEVEVRAPENARGRSVTIPAYALYYVCEDVNGLCMYRRQDLEMRIGIRR